jgi:CTP:molybdopterin cytidylyltransferase MocA
MPRPIVIILHRPPDPDAPSLTRLLATAREALVEHQRRLFLRADADRVLVVTDRAASFGECLADLARRVPRRRGIVVLGSGAVPLLRRHDAERLVAVAAGGGHRVLTNNHHSSDVCAVSDAGVLRGLPPLPTDNALPRWLAEHRGYRVRELPARRRLGIDLDTPLDLALLRHARRAPGPLRALAEDADIRVPRLDELVRLLSDPRGELLVAGRTSARTLRWLERRARCRVRALVEERGMRASSTLALAPAANGDPSRSLRPPASVLGRALAAGGPSSVGALVAAFGDGAVIDTRVLLADRLGVDEAAWPSDEDRYASDLLRADEVRDGWLAALTRGAAAADVPVLLGGHTLVGPGLPLLARATRGAKPRGHAVE